MTSTVTLGGGKTTVNGTFTITGTTALPTITVANEINWSNPNGQVPVWGAAVGTLTTASSTVASNAAVSFQTVIERNRVAVVNSNSGLQVLFGGGYLVQVIVGGGTSWTIHVNATAVAQSTTTAPAGQLALSSVNLSLVSNDVISLVNSGGTAATVSATLSITEMGAVPSS